MCNDYYIPEDGETPPDIDMEAYENWYAEQKEAPENHRAECAEPDHKAGQI